MGVGVRLFCLTWAVLSLYVNTVSATPFLLKRLFIVLIKIKKV